MKSEFKDLFSNQSLDYAKFRPTYPSALFDYLVSLVRAKDLAWDCGTGNGQAALELVKRFKKVIATDPSEKQIKLATLASRLEYRVGTAEKSDLDDQSVDLLTVAQAFHWLQQDLFFAECRRVLKPQGVVAFWCYELAHVNPEIDASVLNFYRGTLGPYWEKERKLVDEGYANVVVPFQELTPPEFAMSAKWSFEHFIGYLSTWSALQTYIKKNQHNPLEDLFPELKAQWKSDVKEVRWKLALRVCKI